MANGINAPYGFKPVLYLNGSSYNGQTNEYGIDTTKSFYTGDLVQFITAGVVSSVLTDAAPRSTGGNAVRTLGVFQGCKYRDKDGNYVFSPFWNPTTGAVDVIGLIIDDPMVVFSAQSSHALNNAENQQVDNKVLGITAENIGKNAEFGRGGTTEYTPVPAGFNQNTAGNTKTGRSGMFVETTGIGTGVDIPLRILKFAPVPENVPYPNGVFGVQPGAFNEVYVLINTHTYKSAGTLGI